MNKYTPLLTTWLFYLFLVISPIWIYMSEWSHLLWFYLAYWFVCDFVNGLFMHRWAAHKLWNPPRLVQYILSYMAVVFLLGTPLSWAAWHRQHHSKVETDKDPHSPSYKSWFYIVFRHRYHNANLKRAPDMLRDKYVTWLSKNEFYIVLFSHIVLLYVLGPLWYLTLIAMPAAFTILNVNFFINVVSHLGNKVSNIPWSMPFIFSEAWHKDHHINPSLIGNKFEISGRIVKALKWT